MSCQRAEGLDLMAFAADRAAAEWAEFRDHYPRCEACSQAVADLAAFEAMLREAGAGGPSSPSAPGGHLDEDGMLSLAQGSLSGAAQARAEAHLEGCARCRTELTVLKRFDFEAVAVEAPAAAPARSAAARSAPSAGLWEKLRDAFEPLLQPAPALGFAAALAAAAVMWWSLDGPDTRSAPPRYAEERSELSEPVTPETPQAGEPLLAEESPPSAEGPAATPELERVDDTPLLAEAGAEPAASPSATVREPAPAPEPQLAEIEVPREPSEPERPPVATDPVAPVEGEREIVLLAALLPDELPRYTRPGGGAFDAFDSMRMDGAVRAGTTDAPRVSVLAPEHPGATQNASPRLYWALDRATVASVEVVLASPDADEPLLEKTIPGPFEAGLHAVDLANLDVRLARGDTYQWSVAVIVDPAAREHDVVSSGGIRRIAPSPTGDGQMTADERARTIHRLAQAGSWYDAFDQTNQWLEAAPENERLLAYREALLDQAKLNAAARWIGTNAR